MKSLTLEASEFLARLVTHVLPDRFQRVRHYGFLANRGKAQRLARIRQLLGVRPEPSVPEPLDWQAWLREVIGVDVLRCPRCGHELFCDELPRTPFPARRDPVSPPPVYHDTS